MRAKQQSVCVCVCMTTLHFTQLSRLMLCHSIKYYDVLQTAVKWSSAFIITIIMLEFHTDGCKAPHLLRQQFTIKRKKTNLQVSSLFPDGCSVVLWKNWLDKEFNVLVYYQRFGSSGMDLFFSPLATSYPLCTGIY